MLPNFIIAGVSRSGTTSLYYYLKQHPEISFPPLKEPRYFSSYDLELPQRGPGDQSVDKKLITEWSTYTKLYEGLETTKIGDASSEYLYNYRSAIPEILNKLGDIPIILILRNPVDRSYSAYNNLIRDGRETLTFEEALEKEEERIKEQYDEMWHYKRVSMYFQSVQAFKENFSKVKVLIFEEFINNKEEHISEIFSFLNLPYLSVDTNTIYSTSGSPKSKWVSMFLGRGNVIGNTLRTVALGFLGRTLIEKHTKFFLNETSTLSKETRVKLLEYFKEDILALEKLLGRDLDIWKK